MSYKTILVHAGADASAAALVGAARSVGARFDATIVGVGALAWDPYADPGLGFADAEAVVALHNDLDSDIQAAERTFRDACAGYPHPVVWLNAMAYPGRALLDHARCADLIVAAHLPHGADERRYADPTDLVMESGLPVLLVPPGQSSIQPGTVVIGWKDGRETRRAISAAMPMLESADRVVVVQICEDGAEAPAEAELEDVVGRLERHGVVAQWQSFPKMGVEADEDLLQVAESWAADLLVLGAYGHSRLREWAFGGVTRGLMAQSAKPILFSH